MKDKLIFIKGVLEVNSQVDGSCYISMRLSIFCMTILLCMVNLSCSNDSVENTFESVFELPNEYKDIIGTWGYQFQAYNIEMKDAYDAYNFYTFHSDGTGMLSHRNSISLIYLLEDDSGFNYYINGNQLNIQFENMNDKYKILSLTSNVLVLGSDIFEKGQKYSKWNFLPDIGYFYGNSGGGTGGESSNERPDIGFYDFTATKTSLKVQYKIYNSSTVEKVTGAKVYYSTNGSSFMSRRATINGALITVNISGLKAGTIYYVKCEAINSVGSTTTDVTKCITNY